ncbi:hypothetical protein FISHEDRAFT_62998 [Fistulina hepatica ATCC 64428]|uniref:Uncharacterized protein n=1 Tax=Fistulina hepatica ATCC 64428 TaxID=1128425 RepID=A0A0D6ZZS3_9AGAR|nr:hypothetical protein FISHEDRAFT_62998 [Fistulina hepatica ATCC 64428]
MDYLGSSHISKVTLILLEKQRQNREKRKELEQKVLYSKTCRLIAESQLEAGCQDDVNNEHYLNEEVPLLPRPECDIGPDCEDEGGCLTGSTNEHNFEGPDLYVKECTYGYSVLQKGDEDPAQSLIQLRLIVNTALDHLDARWQMKNVCPTRTPKSQWIRIYTWTWMVGQLLVESLVKMICSEELFKYAIAATKQMLDTYGEDQALRYNI